MILTINCINRLGFAVFVVARTEFFSTFRLETLCQHLPEGTEENNNTPHNTRPQGRDLNLRLLKAFFMLTV
jgi:hypothetical protein